MYVQQQNSNLLHNTISTGNNYGSPNALRVIYDSVVIQSSSCVLCGQFVYMSDHFTQIHTNKKHEYVLYYTCLSTIYDNKYHLKITRITLSAQF